MQVPSRDRTGRACPVPEEAGGASEASLAWRPARFLSRVSHPLYVSPLVVLAVSLRFSPSAAAAFGWWALYQVFAALIPLVDLAWRRRTGRISDWHVSRREERKWPVVFGIVYAAAGSAAFALLPAPRILLACMLAGLAQGVLTLAVTFYWKISLHLMGSASLAAILYLGFGLRPWSPAAVAMLAYLAAVGMSRYVVRAHTAPQIVAGALAGGVLTWLVFALMGVPA